MFLYGGTKKVNLLEIIVNDFEKIYRKPVIYIEAEKFINELVCAVRERKKDKFNQKYRNTYLLIINNIQFIAGKSYSTQVLISILKELEHKGRQIVLSANCNPNYIKGLDGELRCYCFGGLIFKISS